MSRSEHLAPVLADPAMPPAEPQPPAGTATAAHTPPTPLTPAAAVAATAKEQALWLFQQYSPDDGVLNVTLAIRLRDRLRWWPMLTAVRQLVRRHPALRTVFPEVDGTPARMTLDPDDERACLTLETVETSAATLDQDLRSYVRRPFDLTAGLLVRVGHFVGADDGEVVCLVGQHLIIDGTSVRILARELIDLYRQLCTTGDIPDRLAGEVAVFVEAPSTPEDVRHWRAHLSGADRTAGAIELAATTTEPASYDGGFVLHELSSAGLDALARLSRTLRVTRNIVLLSAYFVLLSRHGAGDDIVVGIPLDVRDPSARSIVGYHVNIVGMRSTLGGEVSFTDLVRRDRDVFLSALKHAAASIDEVFPGSYETTNQWRQPLFRYLFNYPPSTMDELLEAAEPIHVHAGYSRMDLQLVALAHRHGLLFELSYRDQLFTARQATALLYRLEALLVGFARSPELPVSDIPLWNEPDRALAAAAGRATIDDQRVPATGPDRRYAVVDHRGHELVPGLAGELRLLDNAIPVGQAAEHPDRTSSTGLRARFDWDGAVQILAPPPGPGPGPPPADPTAASGHRTAPPGDGDDGLRDVLTGLWRDLLDQPQLDPSANFFAYGGTSLLAGRLVARVKKLTGVRLSLRDVFGAPTPSTLAVTVAAHRAAVVAAAGADPDPGG